MRCGCYLTSPCTRKVAVHWLRCPRCENTELKWSSRPQYDNYGVFNRFTMHILCSLDMIEKGAVSETLISNAHYTQYNYVTSVFVPFCMEGEGPSRHSHGW